MAAEAREWNRAALAMRKMCRRVGLDAASPMASDANFAATLELSASPAHVPIPELDPVDELVRPVSEDVRTQTIPHSVSWSKNRSRADNPGGSRGARL